MTKCIRDGLVAILYSPGYGAGWSTWNDEEFKEFLLHDEKLVELVETEQTGKIKEYVESVFPSGNFCGGGIDELQIAWVPQGTPFHIEECDGGERLILNWNVA
jgi:hypothetical protein